jgi:hypothetical protein
MEPIVSRSHILVQHLMKQMENWQPGQKKRDVRPEWLMSVIEETAELFEPLTGVARVGFDCQLEEETWVVRMYLGTTEIVGGPFDGQMRPMSFEIDLQMLFSRFQDINEFFWSVFPENAEDVDEPQAYITIGGTVGGNPVRLHLFATPPDEAGPGMKIFPDGRFEPV